MALTRSDLIDDLSKEIGLTPEEAEAALEAFLAGVQTGLVSGTEVHIDGFGDFSIIVEAHGKTVRFTPAAHLWDDDGDAQAETEPLLEIRPPENPLLPEESDESGPAVGPGIDGLLSQSNRTCSGSIVLHATVDKPLTPPSRPGEKPNGHARNGKADWGAAGGRGLFYLADALLVLILAYLCWTVAPQLLALQGPAGEMVSDLTAHPKPPPARASEPPLRAYKVVWDRNLFGQVPAAPQREKSEIEKIALAGSDVGLKLIGTVVAKDPARNYAIIEVLSSREQGMYKERERAGNAIVRAILRNNVVVEKPDGSRRRLSLDEQPGAARASVQQSAPAPEPLQAFQASEVFQVSRSQVPSSPDAIRSTIEELHMAPQEQDGSLGGFSVGRLRARDALFQAGLRTGDVLKGVDGEPFRSAQDLEYFFHRLAGGGEITIMAERRGQPVQLNVTVE